MTISTQTDFPAAALKLLDGLSVEPVSASDAIAEAERGLQAGLARIRFAVAVDDLRDAAAFMVTKDGFRRAVFDERLPSEVRMAFCFHLLGHVALGHVHKTQQDFWPEVWNPDDLTPQQGLLEYEADRWAVDLVDRHLNRKTAAESSQFSIALRCIRSLGVTKGGVRGLLHHFHKIIDSNWDWYSHLRRTELAQFAVNAYYRRAERTDFYRARVTASADVGADQFRASDERLSLAVEIATEVQAKASNRLRQKKRSIHT